MCNSKKSKFAKELVAKGLLSNLPVLNLSILSDLPILNTLFYKYKINAIVRKFLLVFKCI